MIGSSMGGLISIYALCEYPAVFRGVACLSTAWLSQIEPGYAIPVATFTYLKNNFPSPEGHRIYMDYGTGESDKSYETTQSFVDMIARGKGYSGSDYSSKTYEKAEHNEVAWSSRLNIPMEFLFPKTTH
jgi:predicted alpha/beta superfamily hydrolase